MKKAFTLAEVLITLGIIGVVAALTLPSLIANQKKQALRAGLKKNYSVISQALEKMQQDLGEMIAPDTYSGKTFKPLYQKYFNVAKDCGWINCIPNTNCDYKAYINNTKTGCTFFDDGQFILQDGSLIAIENPTADAGWGFRVWISVDVNGYQKPPNTWGQDMFTFEIMPDGRLLPMGAEGTYYSETDYCSTTSTDKYNGIACTNRALYDESFWK